jgi:hypothetical protein
MRDTIIRAILNEGAWLTCSMALGMVLVVITSVTRGVGLDRVAIGRAMNLFYGCMIGTMGCGHLLAVTIKWVQNTLEPNLMLMYLLGLVLAVPGWWLAASAFRRTPASVRRDPTTLALNAWLALSLLSVGVHNLPLAAPGLLNIAYQLTGRRAVGWTIAGVALVANVALFAGSLVFWASGQSFEQFSGMP